MYKNSCYCRTTSQELKTNVEEGSARITESTSKIQAEEGILVELKTLIKVSQESREEAELWMTKGASAFDAESSDLAANIDALTMAVAVLEKGVAGSSFLQSRVGSAIRKVAMSSDKVSDSDRSTLSFLSISDRYGYAPKSGEIIGILKQLKDEMSEDLAAAQRPTMRDS